MPVTPAPATAAAATIAVDELRIGMFVELDGGWLSHPFPLSSFRISSAQQITTIRRLGLTRVRWCPRRSASGGDDGDAGDAGVGAARPDALAPADTAPEPLGALPGDLPGADDPIETLQQARRAELAAQRAAVALCERQYAEAVGAWRGMARSVQQEPARASEQVGVLAGALAERMLTQRDACIRLLSDGAGDRQCAHSLNVGIISMLMGRALGLSGDELHELGVGALLHDIGKLELPARLRHADPSMTGPERAAYRDHVAHGVTHGRRMGLGAGALFVIAQHHENADGSGFPHHLNVDRMLPAARIVALVNCYDNLCNPAQGLALTPHEALSQMFAQGKLRFDITMLNTFIRMMGVYPPGSIVQLTDERFAQVIAVNPELPLKPRVLVYEAGAPRDEVLQLDLETTPALRIVRSVRVAQLSPPMIEFFAPHRRIAYFLDAGSAPRDFEPSTL